MNRDGFADVIVGATRDGNNGRRNSGSAKVFSGKDRSVLFTFNGDSADDYFGDSVNGAGDVNREDVGLFTLNWAFSCLRRAVPIAMLLGTQSKTKPLTACMLIRGFVFIDTTSRLLARFFRECYCIGNNCNSQSAALI